MDGGVLCTQQVQQHQKAHGAELRAMGTVPGGRHACREVPGAVQRVGGTPFLKGLFSIQEQQLQCHLCIPLLGAPQGPIQGSCHLHQHGAGHG